MTVAWNRQLHVARAVAVTAVIVSLATSCSSKSDASAPTKLPPLSTTATTPTPTTVLTPEAQVEAAVRVYYETVNTAISTGETGKLTGLSSPDCACRQLISTVDDVYANGKSVGAHFDVHSIDVQDVQGDTAAALVRYDVTAYVVLDKQGSIVERVQPLHADALMSLVRNEAAWITHDIVQLDEAQR